MYTTLKKKQKIEKHEYIDNVVQQKPLKINT